MKYFAADGTVPSFAVDAAPGVSPAVLRDRLATAFPNDNVLTGKQLAAETKKDLDNGVLKVFTIFFLVFAFIAVFVGAFVILNTFSMLVAQRTRELALLRALGASRRQVTRSVLIEAFIVGTFSSVVGLGLGAVIAVGLKALLGRLRAEDQRCPAHRAAHRDLVLRGRHRGDAHRGVLPRPPGGQDPARRGDARRHRDADVASLRVRADRAVSLMLVVGVAVLILGLSGSASHSGALTGLRCRGDRASVSRSSLRSSRRPCCG